jgi:hypothetical protein
MRTLFTNYIILGKANEAPIIERILADEKNLESEEIGFRISGVAVTFDVRNENGGIFQSGDFDKSVRNYFKKNKINMVCPVEHDDGFDNRGVFTSIENADGELIVAVEFYKDCCSLYDVIKSQIKRGILQGFSTYGWINETNEATLINISLVSNPSDTGAKLFKNTKFIGFGEDEPEVAQVDIF